MNDSSTIPQVGTFVRMAAWSGVVQDVFVSESTGRVIIQVYFAKNVYKQQNPEIHFLDVVQDILKESSMEDFMSEIKRYEEMKDKELKKALGMVQKPEPA